MIKIDKVRAFKDIEKNTWDDLLNSAGNKYVFQTYDFQNIWWKHFGAEDKNRELLLLLVKEGSSLIGIAPLMKEKTGFFNIPIIKFVGSPVCDYMDFIAVRGREKDVADHLCEHIKKMKCLEIDLIFLLKDSIICRSNLMDCRQIDENPYVELDKDWEDLYNKVDGKLRRDLSRRERNLSKLGNVRFGIVDKRHEIDRFLKIYFDLHIKRWKDYSGKYSQFQYGVWKDFVTELSHAFFPKGYVDLSYMKVNENTVACHFGFAYNNIFHYYMPTFNPAYSKYAPSKLLILKLLKWSCDRGLSVFDFLRGTELYKFEWASETKTSYNCVSYPDRIYFGVIGRSFRKTKDVYLKHVKGKLKRLTPLMKLWYKTRGVKNGDVY